MERTSLASAVRAMQHAAEAGGTGLSPQVLTQTVELNHRMLRHAFDAAAQYDDPRLVAALAEQAEQLHRLVIRARLGLALRASATGAHTLDVAEYDALRKGRTDYSRPARHATGRPCYKSTADFLAAWLRIDYHEAAGMLADAQLVIGRITMAGAVTAPRFERLAETYHNPAVDPRQALRTARALNRLEPADTIAQGDPLAPAARHSDGELLERHAARMLESHDQRTGKSKSDALVAEYRQAHAQTKTPEEGLTRIRTINGVDEYRLRVRGANAGLLRSLFAQADNPKTQAGAAARLPQSDAGAMAPPADAAAAPQQEDLAPWLSTTDPPPAWAVDPDAPGIPGSTGGHDGGPDGRGSSAAPGQPAARTPQATAPVELTPDGPGASPSIAEQVIEQLPPRLRRMNALMALIEQRLVFTGTGPGSSTGNDTDPAGDSPNGNGGCRCRGKTRTRTVEPELLVFIRLDDLTDLATAHGVTSHGVKLSPTELRRLLCRSKIIPIVFGGDGQVLDLGRSSRLYPDYLKKGIIARDRGCIVPGCTHPPEVCDVHHAGKGGWQGGCPTDIRCGTLLCRLHHTAEQAGIIKVIMHQGLPHVILPRHIDPTGTPRRNEYWQDI